MLARRSARGAQVEARDAQRAGGRGEEPAQHAEGRGLAGAVRAEEPENLAAMDPEIDAIDRGEGAEPAHEVADFDDDLAACFTGNNALVATGALRPRAVCRPSRRAAGP